MKKLLHIIASPRKEESRTLKVSSEFLKKIKQRHPHLVLQELDLVEEKLPSLTRKTVEGKYTLLSGKDLSKEGLESWKEILRHIDLFLSADVYLITTPMWNFGVPYFLKHYIDIIMQPKYLFKYTEKGVEGLAKNKKMIVITSRGGDYKSKEMKLLDFQEPYLKTVFGFAGIIDIKFIHAQPMDQGEEKREKSLKEAKEEAAHLALEI